MICEIITNEIQNGMQNFSTKNIVFLDQCSGNLMTKKFIRETEATQETREVDFVHEPDANPGRIPTAICLPLALYIPEQFLSPPWPLAGPSDLGGAKTSEDVRGRAFWLTNTAVSKSATNKNILIHSPLIRLLPTTPIPVLITQNRVRIRFYNKFGLSLCLRPKILKNCAYRPLFWNSKLMIQSQMILQF